MFERALTAKEVAQLLGVDVGTVYKLARAGELGHYRVGDSVRFPRQDVEAFLQRVYRPGRVTAGEGDR